MSNLRSVVHRRQFVVGASSGVTALAVGPSWLSAKVLRAAPGCAGLTTLGPLGPADSNGVRLPEGFRSRVVAATGLPVATGFLEWSNYLWHMYPDGGATFPTGDGGWVYVSNSETLSFLGGGAGAILFDADGNPRDAYRILEGTNVNCAGGATPWNTWLSCEEIAFGRVVECDPFGVVSPVVRSALGYFQHEAVAVDTIHAHLYLTEDESDGRLYRFVPAALTPEGHPNLASGTLQAAVVSSSGAVTWSTIPNPRPRFLQTPTRRQVRSSTAFNGGEGIWFHEGTIYFTTKGDHRVWALDTITQTLRIIYDRATAPDPVLSGVDNVTVTPDGQILVAEDGGDMQIVVIDPSGGIAPLVQVVDQDSSEITGLAFNPDGTRLYFSSQRGGALSLGLTYEVEGPFSDCFSF